MRLQLRRWSRAAAFLVAVGVGMTLHAQPAQEGLFDAAFDAVMRREGPEYGSQRRMQAKHPHPEVQMQWGTGDRTVSVRYFVLDSPESASKLLARLIVQLPVAVRKTEGFGDEAYALVVHSEKTPGRIWFRRGRVVLDVAAAGEGAPQRFARLFGEVVARSTAGRGNRP